jgi:hypothetical protein
MLVVTDEIILNDVQSQIILQDYNVSFVDFKEA